MELNVTKYLKENGRGSLEENYGIIVKDYIDVEGVPNLYVLNYNQIESPKNDPITNECRGLILDENFDVVSRSFDRFYNCGENDDDGSGIDFSKASIYEKVDGSLIKIYHHNGMWEVSTRGTAFAEAETHYGIKFRKLVFKALDVKFDEEFQYICSQSLDDLYTYIFEVTSRENRVVKRYDGYTLHYLASRNNWTGEYGGNDRKYEAVSLGAREIKEYHFKSVDECLQSAKELEDFDEGFVVYVGGIPRMKVKSPQYLVAHAIKGEGLSPLRIMQLVLNGDVDEYLAYFEEDWEFFDPYIDTYERMIEDMNSVFSKFNRVEDQKEFALHVKGYPFFQALFTARKNKELPETSFHKLWDNTKLKVFETYHKSLGKEM